MPIGRALHDLPGKAALELFSKATTKEQEVTAGAQLLHRQRDRRLNVDLCQHFDKVTVRDQEVAGRLHRTERLIEQREPSGHFRRRPRKDGGVIGDQRRWRLRHRAAIGAKIVEPAAEMRGLADALHQAPIAARRQRALRHVVIPGVHHQRQQRQRRQRLMQSGRRHVRRKRLGHHLVERDAVFEVLNILRGAGEVAAQLVRHLHFGGELRHQLVGRIRHGTGVARELQHARPEIRYDTADTQLIEDVGKGCCGHCVMLKAYGLPR